MLFLLFCCVLARFLPSDACDALVQCVCVSYEEENVPAPMIFNCSLFVEGIVFEIGLDEDD